MYDGDLYFWIAIWYIIVVISLLAHSSAIHILVKKKNKRVMDWLIMHLCCAEVMFVIWDVSFYSSYFGTGRSFMNGYSRDWEYTSHLVGEIIIDASIYQSMFWITLDRVLSVKLAFKYSLEVTPRNIGIFLTITWVVSIVQGLIYMALPRETVSLIYVIWDCVIVGTILFSYGYIILAVKKKRRRFSTSETRANHQRLRYQVPLLIVLSFTLFCLIPDILLEIDEKFETMWLYCIWLTNYMVDPLIYVFNTKKKFCRPFKKCCMPFMKLPFIREQRRYRPNKALLYRPNKGLLQIDVGPLETRKNTDVKL